MAVDAGRSPSPLASQWERSTSSPFNGEEQDKCLTRPSLNKTSGAEFPYTCQKAGV